MYKLEYLPLARQDMLDISRYISRELCNPEAAWKLAEEMVEAADELRDFPYSNAVYVPIRQLRYEYRKLHVKNYIMFYRVDEAARKITIARVVYARRDYEKLL